ncbi:hypothetical protein B0J18DRAFT_491251 [Chaetomium sp. MPI-SDFR-AT-0129]|nr:hypothetical protein B0J18DRAFT_491251 [Chaetomium sp. MPI-SDFR-AT-0129]
MAETVAGDVPMADASEVGNSAVDQANQATTTTTTTTTEDSSGSAHQDTREQSAPAGSDTATPTDTAPAPAPGAFPKKRRGRPPGRPNATVRDADYEENELVKIWNASKTEPAVPVVSINIRDALTEQSLVHDTQRTIFRLASRETILFVQGWITAKHIASQRPSYVNGLLIHSRGHDAAVSCAQCVEKRGKGALGPFMVCRVLPGYYHDSCSNCKWFDNTSSCSLYTGSRPNRKRKAKELLPAPESGGDAAADAEGTTATATDVDHGEATKSSSSARQQDGPVDPKLGATGLPQPDADMGGVSSLDNESPQQEEQKETPAGDEHDQDHDGDDSADPSPSDSHSHFQLGPSATARDQDQEGEGEDEEEDSGFVAAQLAAQLLPELHRSDV